MAWAESHRLLIHGRLLLAGHPWGIDGLSAYDVMAVVQTLLVELIQVEMTAGKPVIQAVDKYLDEAWSGQTTRSERDTVMSELDEMRAEMGQRPAEEYVVQQAQATISDLNEMRDAMGQRAVPQPDPPTA